jgi:AcrR family transcriptional regulator
MAGPTKKELRRDHILAAAQAVAAREGAGAATLRAIASEAGMAPNAVLYYFGGLAEIEAAAVQASSDRFLQSLADAVESGGGPTARLAAALQAGISGGMEDDASRILYEYWSHSLRNAELRRIQEEFTRAQQSNYEGIIAEGIASGEFHPVLEPADIARIIVAQEDGLVMDVLSGVASSREVFELNARLAAVLLGVDPASLLELSRT